MTLFQSRTSAGILASFGLAAAVALSGCSAGQISQSAIQQPAINGTQTWVGDSTTGIALRNVHLRVDQTSDYVQPGSDVELIFVAVNESPDEGDRLVSITSDIGNVAVTGDLRVAPSGSLVVGTPDGQPTELAAIEAADTAEAAVELTQKISNGFTYPFTFTFERSGVKEIVVPISAGESPRREPPAGAASDTGGE